MQKYNQLYLTAPQDLRCEHPKKKNMVEHIHDEIFENDQIIYKYSLSNLIVNRDSKYVHLGAGIFPKIRV